MTAIQVVGIGLDGVSGLSAASLARLQQADRIVGSARHREACCLFQGEFWPLKDLPSLLENLRSWLEQPSPNSVVILASGDPLFFGLGRLLLESLPPEKLSFYPHLSSVQLAFSRLKLPWQDAIVISIHGRDPDRLISALRRNSPLIAVLTDPHHCPSAIAQAIIDLALPCSYTLWVCENLGGADEKIHQLTPETTLGKLFAPLTVVVLQRQPTSPAPPSLPRFGLPDAAFLAFADRPGLITKREVRVQVLGELQLHPSQTVWDIGSGTGSVAIEIARLLPDGQIYAVEKTAAGAELIRQNIQRFAVGNIQVIAGSALDVIQQLPSPDRIFIGGSGGELLEILEICDRKLQDHGQITLALTTLEHQQQVITWRRQRASQWGIRLLQVNFARSVTIADLTRWSPLNPLVLISLWRHNRDQ